MTKKRLSCIIMIYCLSLLFLIFKMIYYGYEIQGFPDENAHIGYVIYLDESKKIIPEYERMHQYSMVCEEGSYGYYQEEEGSINYLGHPPFYYHLMRLFANTENVDGYVKVDILAMRIANMLLTAMSFVILYYICFSRFIRRSTNILPHLIVTVSSVSVPMTAYIGAGVSNDNLITLGMMLLFWGCLRYYEDKIDFLTYGLVGIGFAISILTKLTAGEMAVVVLLIIVLHDLIRKRGLKIFLNKYFAATVICYILPIVYYLSIYLKYHAFQPSLQVLDYDYYKTTTFYVAQNAREVLSFTEYFKYYWTNFIYTWVTIYGHNGWINKYGAWLGWLGPLLIVIFPIIQMVRCFISKTSKSGFYLAFLGGLLFTAITQFVHAYQTFLSAGYSGGYQSRYYLCLIPFFAYASGELWCGHMKNNVTLLRKKRRIRSAMCIAAIVYCMLLIYGDFVYFLLYRDFIG